MAYENIIYEKKDGIAYITFNRPHVYNALSQGLVNETMEALKDANSDDSVRVVILTGAGEKAFVSGADINELKVRDTFMAVGVVGQERRALGDMLENMSKPTIAAINGFALGGGCELSMACTLRIASENARFGQPEINLGIIPGLGGTQRLTRLVGKTKAMELVLIGEQINAQEAYRIGLVNAVVPPDKLMDTAREFATKIVAKSAYAIRLAKDAVNTGANMSVKEALDYENKIFAILCGSEDKKEGTTAFLVKRKPAFKGR